MDMTPPGFFARLALAWRVLVDGAFAARALRAAEQAEALPQPAPASPAATAPTAETEPAAPTTADPTTAFQLLAILQREGRLIDFLNEDVAAFSDADIGGAARVVHAGCKRALEGAFTVKPIRAEAEGDPVELAPGFDARRNTVTGNVVGEPPFRGRLAHPGWHVTEVRLPRLNPGHDASVVAPAEIEL